MARISARTQKAQRDPRIDPQAGEQEDGAVVDEQAHPEDDQGIVEQVCPDVKEPVDDQPREKYHLQDAKNAKDEVHDSLGASRKEIKPAFGLALAAQAVYKEEIRKIGEEIIEKASHENRQVVILAGHPYHVDPLINHKIPEALADMGVDVITEDAVPLSADPKLADPLVLTQWEYLNRIFHAARWAGEQVDIEIAQLNSFGCGPDAFAIDEVPGILEEYGKNQTVIRIDEINSLGSARLRLRSMLQARKVANGKALARSLSLACWALPPRRFYCELLASRKADGVRP